MPGPPTSVNQLIEAFRALGISRSNLPDNLIEFFGLFASERRNVINGVTHIRQSPLISPRTPVHGLMVDLETGRLEWLVNGYEHVASSIPPALPLTRKVGQAKEMIHELASLDIGQMKFPEVKIGDLTIDPRKWISQVQIFKEQVEERFEQGHSTPSDSTEPPKPLPIPIPPPIQLVKPFRKRNQ